LIPVDGESIMPALVDQQDLVESIYLKFHFLYLPVYTYTRATQENSFPRRAWKRGINLYVQPLLDKNGFV